MPKGDQQAGNGRTSEEVKAMAEVYVEKRIEGAGQGIENRREAARAAGYADSTVLKKIERPGGPVATKMEQALAERGITETFVAGEYADGIAQVKAGNEAFDGIAHAKYLLQLSYLLGYGKHTPQVAIQINNGALGQGEEHDPARIEELIERAESIIELLAEEVGRREPAGVHEGSAEVGDPGACPGVDDVGSATQAASGGGGS